MKKNVSKVFRIARGANPGLLMLGVLCFGLLAMAPAASAQNLPGLTVIGVNNDGTETTLESYRWLVEEDRTYHVAFDAQGNPIVDPRDDAFDKNWENTLSVSFHKSYMPVVAKGCFGMPAEAACKTVPFSPEDGKYYFVSVLPLEGYTIGGVGFRQGDASMTAYVHQTPLPTAQISIQVFPDMEPLNGAPDTPPEDPEVNGIDMSGFQIIVEDGGGRYGAAAGVMSTDVYGNPLGTTYNDNCDRYDPTCVLQQGSGIVTDANGWAHIYNIAQGKYGIQAVPPAGQGWVQTSTIEGTKIIDAWVKPNEPPFFAEFGPPGPHVFIGFTKEFNAIQSGSASLTGTIVNQHMSRPPDYAFYNGAPFGHTTPWVGLNDLSVGIGKAVYAAPVDVDGSFKIPQVPDGNYQLVVWDSALDLIMAFKTISIVNGQCNTLNSSCDLGDVPAFQWFHRQEHYVFNDNNGNGIWEEGEPLETALPEFALNLRWRDGSLYQGNVSDFEGAYAFDQIFPFFSWLTTEVDFGRLEATGVTVVVDNGGPINPDDYWTFGGQLNPQDQTNPATGPGVEYTTHRLETGPSLVEAFQGFIGQTNVFMWGKRHYPNDQNGGISGIVWYDVTRAENDPAQAAAEPWTPGIPGVRVNLYDETGATLLNSTTSDSWDESIPTGCKDGNGVTGGFVFDPDGDGPIPSSERDCYDGLRNFNQARPGVFDGGYAFNDFCPIATGGMPVDLDGIPSNLDIDGNPLCADDSVPVKLLPANYIVEVVPPAGYEIYKPEDKNVDFGDSYYTKKLVPPCVGALTEVPAILTLYPTEAIPAPFAGTSRPLCDRKLAVLEGGANAAADFFLFTEVPIAAHGIGFILDDTQNEFDPNAPNFGEKYAPPFMPVSIRDWTGREIGRTYSDQYGVYNFMVPSTSTTNVPAPSGMSPNMLGTCMNDATLPDGTTDPNHNPIYSQFCYTLQYMPGVYTYLDTPVVPVGAFAGPDQFPVDCEYPDATPRIYSVSVGTNGVGGGPYVPLQNNGNVLGDQQITITSMGTVQVPNPNYCNNAAGNCPAGADTLNRNISRDYGFGSSGSVTIDGLGALDCAWGDPISCTIPGGTGVGVGGRQLTVTRDDGGSTVVGVTVQFGLRGNGGNKGQVVQITAPELGDLESTLITDAIEAAGANDLILVGPGSYNEMVIMSKPVQLQGWGEGSTTINALKQPVTKLVDWRLRVQALIEGGAVDLLPGQEAAFGGIEQVALMTEEGAGVLVLAPSGGQNRFSLGRNRGARIDGFTITGADTGGGIVVNGYGHYVEISNNRITNNSGVYGGGIRVGHPLMTNLAQTAYQNGNNDFVKVHHNQVKQNGALDGAGAGISMCTGSDSYAVTSNWVCGNFITADGGGIGHFGLSDGALIEDNTIIFNETFIQGLTVSGGGLFIGGAPPVTPGSLSPGSGNVVVNRNLIQGNAAGAGDGGGIRLDRINGQDVDSNNNSNAWYSVDLFNNIIVNNVAGLAGGGISIQDAVKVNILHNTVANNDSLGTAGQAFNNPNQSTPQPGAGIATHSHSQALIDTGKPIGDFSDPLLDDTIVWHNRKFFFKIAQGTPGDPNVDPGTWGLCPDIGSTITNLNCPGGDAPVYDDLGVIGAAGPLVCDGACIDSGGSNPLFVNEYVNGNRSSIFQNEVTTIQVPAAFDEGGNFIQPRFGPLTLINYADSILYDYHVSTNTNPQGIDLSGTFPTLSLDFDSGARTAPVDIGADEFGAEKIAVEEQQEMETTRSGATRRVGGGN